MPLTKRFLDTIALVADGSGELPLLPWPSPGNPGGFLSFQTFAEWHEFVVRLDLNEAVPETVGAKFERAQKLYLLAWLDFDLIKVGELVALTALELALKDRYGEKLKDKRGNIKFARSLKHLVNGDGLTDDKVSIVCRCGGSVVGLLTGERKPSLADIRNDLAHGYPFDSFPWAGLLELVRDLIEYAYRDMISEVSQRKADPRQARKATLDRLSALDQELGLT